MSDKQTWLSPYWSAWQAQYGASPAALSGVMAKVLRPLEVQHGTASVLEQFRLYLAQTSVTYVSLMKFSAGFGSWACKEKDSPRFAADQSADVGRRLCEESDAPHAKIVAMLAAAYPTPAWTDEQARLYREMIADLDYEQASAATIDYIRSSSTRPTVAALRDAVRRRMEATHQLPSELEPDEAWGWVNKCFVSVGRYRPFPTDQYPLVAETVARLGWETLCDSSNPEADRAHFHRAYQAALQRTRTERMIAPALCLPGDTQRLCLRHGITRASHVR